MKTVQALAVALSLAVASPAIAAQTAEGLPAVTSADRVLGRADAPVTVVEYASFTCSHCAEWYTDVLPTFKTRFIDTGQVKLVFRNLPTAPAQVAMTAAAIGRCAAPERFFDVAGVLMSDQAAAVEAGDGRAWFQSAIAASGRTEAQIQTCFADPATQARLTAEAEGARAAGVQGTPTFFVNGTKVQDTSLDGLSAAITPLID